MSVFFRINIFCPILCLELQPTIISMTKTIYASRFPVLAAFFFIFLLPLWCKLHHLFEVTLSKKNYTR